MKNHTLVLLGTGIKFLSHLTIEAETYIKQANKLLYLHNDPAMKAWIKKNNINAESLDNLYTKHTLRIDCYREITDYILQTLEENSHVCVVQYGHPTLFATPGLNAAVKAKKAGHNVLVLAGISAEDCLFADLLINPGDYGYQSFEATDFLVRKRVFDTRSHLILWQVGIIGLLGHSESFDNTLGAQVLCDYLLKYYSRNHQLIIYEAAQYPHFPPKIQSLILAELPNATFSAISTLYIPPANKREIDWDIVKALNIDLLSYQKLRKNDDQAK